MAVPFAFDGEDIVLGLGLVAVGTVGEYFRLRHAAFI
jgi:hypothetical protein